MKIHDWIMCCVVIASAVACDNGGESGARAGEASTQEQEGAGVKITKYIDTPAHVRSNLGMNFASVERRHVGLTKVVPGVFEAPPHADRQYLAPLSGRIELAFQQYESVAIGQELFRIDSPEWRAIKTQLSRAHADIAAKESELDLAGVELEGARSEIEILEQRGPAFDALEASIDAQREALSVAEETWQQRLIELEALAAAGAGKADEIASVRASINELRMSRSAAMKEKAELNLRREDYVLQLALKRTALPALESHQQAAEVAHASALLHYQGLLEGAASVVGEGVEWLTQMIELRGEDVPRWRSLQYVVVKSQADGVAMRVDAGQGAWVEAGSMVLATLDPSQLRLRAHIPQDQLPFIRNGLTARIYRPEVGASLDGAYLEATVEVVPRAEAQQRTFDVVLTPSKTPDWARVGVSTYVEVELDSSAEESYAIPLAATIQDGLDRIFFLRDPDNGDRVERMVGDFGVTDGRWIEVKSGVIEGDQVVLEGIYELKLTGQGQVPKGGHFHADGTWHAGPDH